MGIRSRGGFNNNPDVLQFSSSFKKIILGAAIWGRYGNCQILDDVHVMRIPTKYTESVEFITGQYEVEEEDWMKIYTESLSKSSEFKKNVLRYII